MVMICGIILVTAILSGFIAILIAYAFFRLYLKNKLNAEINRIADLIEIKVKKGTGDGFSQVIDVRKEEVGQMIEKHVRKGFISGVSAIQSSEVIKGTTKSIARTSIDLVKGIKPGF